MVQQCFNSQANILRYWCHLHLLTVDVLYVILTCYNDLRSSHPWWFIYRSTHWWLWSLASKLYNLTPGTHKARSCFGTYFSSSWWMFTFLSASCWSIWTFWFIILFNIITMGIMSYYINNKVKHECRLAYVRITATISKFNHITILSLALTSSLTILYRSVIHYCHDNAC